MVILGLLSHLYYDTFLARIKFMSCCSSACEIIENNPDNFCFIVYGFTLALLTKTSKVVSSLKDN